jgi:hypothetical protein
MIPNYILLALGYLPIICLILISYREQKILTNRTRNLEESNKALYTLYDKYKRKFNPRNNVTF